jgi:hypothetical protein
MLWCSHDERDGSDVLIVRDQRNQPATERPCIMQWLVSSVSAVPDCAKRPSEFNHKRQSDENLISHAQQNPKLYDRIYVVSPMVEWARSLHALK